MKVWNGSTWERVHSPHDIGADIYEAVLEYKDVFHNVFRTVHPRALWTDPATDSAVIGDKSKQHEMMARANGPTPIFLTGREAIRAPADLPTVEQAQSRPEPCGPAGFG